MVALVQCSPWLGAHVRHRLAGSAGSGVQVGERTSPNANNRVCPYYCYFSCVTFADKPKPQPHRQRFERRMVGFPPACPVATYTLLVSRDKWVFAHDGNAATISTTFRNATR